MPSAAGNTIALAYLLFERGVLTEKDTGGVALAAPCFDLLVDMVQGEGLGALLAQGSYLLASKFEVEELSVHVNGLEVPMHDPRALSGQALAYVTSPRGACHNQSDYFTIELGGTVEELNISMTDRHNEEGKARFVARHRLQQLGDLLLCSGSTRHAGRIAEGCHR